jgi:hypothetical protein
MWPFKRKPTTAWEEQYANNIYEGLVAHNDFGDITALKLRIPFGLHQAYHNKILLQREFICFQAFAVLTKGDCRLSLLHSPSGVPKSVSAQAPRNDSPRFKMPPNSGFRDGSPGRRDNSHPGSPVPVPLRKIRKLRLAHNRGARPIVPCRAFASSPT